MQQQPMDENNAQQILEVYKRIASECSTIAAKVSELGMERDEHKLVMEKLSVLEPQRKAYRLIGGVLTERTVEDVLPHVTDNFEGVCIYFSYFLPFHHCECYMCS